MSTGTNIIWDKEALTGPQICSLPRTKVREYLKTPTFVQVYRDRIKIPRLLGLLKGMNLRRERGVQLKIVLVRSTNDDGKEITEEKTIDVNDRITICFGQVNGTSEERKEK